MAVTKENGYVMTLNENLVMRINYERVEDQEPIFTMRLEMTGPGTAPNPSPLNPRFIRGFNELWSLIRLDFPDAPTWNS